MYPETPSERAMKAWGPEPWTIVEISCSDCGLQVGRTAMKPSGLLVLVGAGGKILETAMREHRIFCPHGIYIHEEVTSQRRMRDIPEEYRTMGQDLNP